MDLQQEKNKIENFVKSSITTRKSLFIEKDNIFLKKNLVEKEGYKNQIIQFSPRINKVAKLEKKKSWYYRGKKDLILKNALTSYPHLYSSADLFRSDIKVVKRLIDIIISLTAIFILLPVFIVIAYKVRRNLGSPIFFYQERPGKNGKLFKMIKFRSMRNAFDQDGNPLPDKFRITPFGQKLRSTSLDEMPQLINVLKGDMSIVGPRPQMKEFLEHYTAEQMRRHEVKPGMTGLAQVSGRNNLSWEEKFDLDVQYVEKNNIWLDFKIMFKTAKVMFNQEGINAPDQEVGAARFCRKEVTENHLRAKEVK